VVIMSKDFIGCFEIKMSLPGLWHVRSVKMHKNTFLLSVYQREYSAECKRIEDELDREVIETIRG